MPLNPSILTQKNPILYETFLRLTGLSNKGYLKTEDKLEVLLKMNCLLPSSAMALIWEPK